MAAFWVGDFLFGFHIVRGTLMKARLLKNLFNDLITSFVSIQYYRFICSLENSKEYTFLDLLNSDGWFALVQTM